MTLPAQRPEVIRVMVVLRLVYVMDVETHSTSALLALIPRPLPNQALVQTPPSGTVTGRVVLPLDVRILVTRHRPCYQIAPCPVGRER
jgi:hypothetical protein